MHLLPKPHAGERNARVILWNEALEPNLSPYGQNSSNRRRFQGQALAVKELRNRATHRRLLVKDQNRIQNAHRDYIELLRAINPELGDWFKNQKWIPNVLAVKCQHLVHVECHQVVHTGCQEVVHTVSHGCVHSPACFSGVVCLG